MSAATEKTAAAAWVLGIVAIGVLALCGVIALAYVAGAVLP